MDGLEGTHVIQFKLNLNRQFTLCKQKKHELITAEHQRKNVLAQNKLPHSK